MSAPFLAETEYARSSGRVQGRKMSQSAADRYSKADHQVPAGPIVQGFHPVSVPGYLRSPSQKELQQRKQYRGKRAARVYTGERTEKEWDIFSWNASVLNFFYNIAEIRSSSARIIGELTARTEIFPKTSICPAIAL